MLYDAGSISSPEKAKTEKFEDLTKMDQKRSEYKYDQEVDPNNLTLHSLKKRSSMKERYNSFNVDKREVLGSNGIVKSEDFYKKQIESSEINLPNVNRDTKIKLTKFDK